MRSHTRTPALLAVLAGACAAGCLNPNLYPHYAYPYPAYAPADKSAPPPVDNRPAESVTRAQFNSPGSTPLPVPTPVPPTLPTVMPPPRSMGGTHDRTTPTISGEKLALGPNEMPIDRAMELTRRLEELADENRRLQARIVALEATGLTREQALNEALREVKTATELANKARGDLQALRNELAALRERVKKAEDRELDTLNKVIEAIKQLLDDK